MTLGFNGCIGIYVASEPSLAWQELSLAIFHMLKSVTLSHVGRVSALLKNQILATPLPHGNGTSGSSTSSFHTVSEYVLTVAR